MTRNSILLPVFLFLCVLTYGQSDVNLDDLAFHADVMTNASDAEHRQRGNVQLVQGLSTYLAQNNVTEALVNALPWVRIEYPADSSFALLSWAVADNVGESAHFGFLKHLDGEVIELSDSRSLRSEYASFSAKSWYGAIYYGMMAFDHESIDGKAYVLLGFDANDTRTNKRVAEVLSFSDGEVVFGAPIFAPETGSEDPDMRSRIIIEYGDAANGQMKFDQEQKMIIYDNIEIVNAGPEGPVPLPDGSYKAFKFQNGTWTYIEKLYDLKLDSPPGEGRQGEEADLFGRKKKN